MTAARGMADVRDRSPAGPPAGPTPVAAARAIGDQLRAAAPRIERARRLPPDVVALLRSHGLFRFWVPAVYGGPEASVRVGLDAFVELARHDASTAWCSFIANTTALLAVNLAPEWAARIYGPPDAVTGGFIQPMGRAVRAPGGLRVSGRWPWGSGTHHCTMIGGGCTVVGEVGAGDVPVESDGLTRVFAFFDPEDVTFIDNWHTIGLRGSGSGDYTVCDAFVPDGRWVDLSSEAALARHHVDTTLSPFPFYGLFASGVACTALGLAERAIEELVRLAQVKRPQESSRVLAERASAQSEIARADAVVRSSRAFIDAAVDTASQRARDGDALTTDDRRALRLAFTDTTQRCADTVGRIYRLAGGDAVHQRSPFERLLRDVNTVSQHAITADRTYELLGRLTLGLRTDTALL